MFNLDHFLIYENVTFLDVILTWKWKTDRIVNDKKAIFEIPFDFLLHAINHNIFELTRNSKNQICHVNTYITNLFKEISVSRERDRQKKGLSHKNSYGTYNSNKSLVSSHHP